MKKIRIWIVILVFLFALTLTGTVLAATSNQTAGPEQMENKTDAVETVSSGPFATIPDGILATTYVYTNSTPLNIPDNQCTSGVVSSTLVVTDSFIIGDVNVGVWLPHTYRGDVELWLVNPNGTRVPLMADQGGGADNINALFDDASPNTPDSATHTPPPPYYYAWWHPEGDLSVFNNLNAQGTWTIEACDDAGGDTGTLTNWTLFFSSGLVLTPDTQSSTACKGNDVTYEFSVINATAVTQSFSIAYASVWPNYGPSTTPVLGVGESWAFQVTHHIPWSANPTDEDTLQVTISGGGDSDTSIATTTAAMVQGWQDYSNIPTEREVRAPSVVHWDGKLYKIGGYGYPGGLGAAQPWLDIYDIASDTWSQGADMPGARYWMDCVPIDLTGSDPKIYCAGGYLSSAQNTLYIYDINTNTWTTGAALPAARTSYAGVVHNNLYYVIGGYTTAYQATMIAYDPATNTWNSALASMSVSRRYHSAEVIGSKIYVAGGYNPAYLSSAEVYDIAANTWSPIASMPTPWLNAADGALNNRYMVLAGGSPSSTASASNGALIYDSLTNTWEWLPLFNHIIYGAEGDFDGTNFWVVSGRQYANGVFTNSPYTTKMVECLNTCTPVSGVDFTVDPAMPIQGVPATFFATLAAGSPPLIFDWNFGDGGTGIGQTTDHTFANPGSYGVSLTATNCDGAGSENITHDVTVLIGPSAEITPSFLEAIQCPDCQTEQMLNVCNVGDLDLTWNLTEAAEAGKGLQKGIESLSGSFVVFDPTAGGSAEYIPNTSQTFCFRAETFTNDYEYRYGAWLKFPNDWAISDAYVVGTPVCESGEPWEPFDWYFETSPYEMVITHTAYMTETDHCIANYCVDLTTGASSGDASVSWYWDGDGYAGAPHHPCSSDVYTPASMVAEPCDEAINPQAIIPEANIDYLPWLSEVPTSGTVLPGACEVVTATFDSTGLGFGAYTGNLLFHTNDPSNEEVTLPVTLTVGPLVEFVYYDLEDVVQPGEAVYLAGDFNGWDPGALQMTPNGDYSVFSVTIPLSIGMYEYKYVVGEGHWDWLQTGDNRSVEITDPMTVEDYRNIVLGWYVLQWPPATSTTVHIPTENIYGQTWAWSFSEDPGAPRAFMTELGYGTDADPSIWTTWTEMPWFSQEGNNDQFAGTIIPDETGVYSYAVRYNGNWGAGNPNNFWYYGDTNGNDYNPADAGVLTVVGPSIELVKTVGTNPNECATTDNIEVWYDTEVVYCFKVTNTGDLTLRVHDLWDDQLGDVLSGALFDLEPDASKYVTATATITEDVVNTATWTAWDNDTHYAKASDSATVTVYVPQADLSVTKTGPATVKIGETFSYILTVENFGLDSAVNVVVVDTLPAGVTVVSLPEPCSVASGVVTCQLGEIAFDDSVVLEIEVTALGTVGEITNTVEVSSLTTDPDDSNNSDSLVTVVEEGVFFTYLALIVK